MVGKYESLYQIVHGMLMKDEMKSDIQTKARKGPAIYQYHPTVLTNYQLLPRNFEINQMCLTSTGHWGIFLKNYLTCTSLPN